ncbi:MAG TPA: 1-phosphofructokinase family hexose kinase [Bryobacteraceae bacterium]|nr:1-phosphofructokinase family hexose kinase [Bryobacteraceae bacterium]
MIITLTINPSVDRTVTVDRLVFEDRAYILSRSDSAGGRGINASRVLHSYGAKTLAIVTSGGANGDKFTKLLGKWGFPVKVVPIQNEIRTNFTIVDRQGLAIKLNEVGPPVSSDELARLEHVVERRLEPASWLMLCGSLPPSVRSDFYNKLIGMARNRNVKTLLDTDGDALLHGVEASPTVVTPNQPEAERLLNRALITRAHFIEAATRIKAMGAETVLLSLGSRGVVAVNENQLLEAIPPRVDAVSPIGAGDALAAAYVWAATKKKDFADCVRWGVAAGTASARLPGVQFPDLDQTKEIYKSVEVRKIQ